MAYRVALAAAALADFAELQSYLAQLDRPLADRITGDLQRILTAEISARPLLHPWFYRTGAPYRARLFRISRRTQFWIVYEVHEGEELVAVLRLWNASRDPAAFEI